MQIPEGFGIALLVGIASILTGCPHASQLAYARTMQCASYETTMRKLPDYRYEVEGCGKPTITYICPTPGCEVAPEHRDVTDAMHAQLGVRSEPGEVHRRRSDKSEEMTAEIRRMQRGLRVMAGASPEQSRTQVLMQFHRLRAWHRNELASCDLRLLVNLQRVQLDEPTRTETRVAFVWELKLPVETAVAIARADLVTWRVCDEEWEMESVERERLAELLIRFRKATAWDEAPRSVGHRAREPEGGWPAWSRALPSLPATLGTAPLDPVALYERTRKSVYKVQVDAGSSHSLGSAVAITKTQLLTNCHVVQGAKTITVGDGKDVRAKIVKADPTTDRCVIEVLNGDVNAIEGVRAYGDLKVGERAYTVGAPEGFESSLGEGLVSGLREDEGLHYVQTTAPISPGSSGGGLFDARGNLIGITTLVYVGEQKVAQQLNFAIAADEFFTD